jgi:hypothetical protein
MIWPWIDTSRATPPVADDDGGVRPAPRDADTLALSARHFMRVTLRHIGVQAHLAQQLVNPRPRLALRLHDLVNEERLGDYFGHGHARVEGRERVLEDDLHLAAHRPHFATACVRDILAGEQHAAARRFVEPQHRASHSRLAAAGFPLSPMRFWRMVKLIIDGAPWPCRRREIFQPLDLEDPALLLSARFGGSPTVPLLKMAAWRPVRGHASRRNNGPVPVR